jgi:SPP1 gp7 family putative phage head morphogenesis protein
MADKPLSVGFNVPFEEAIKATDAREVVLPSKYYGELQGIHRQLSFSVAGLATHDQLNGVLDSLKKAVSAGTPYKKWADELSVEGVALPPYRLENIYRTNLQNAYQRGHWEQVQASKAVRPFLMYDAINDTRTRPSHKAMDGIIRPVDDPFWNSHYPSNGFMCRCTVISLSEAQAKSRSGGDNGLNKKVDLNTMKPDNGWDYNVGEDISVGVNKAIKDKAATTKASLKNPLKKSVLVPPDDKLNIDNIVAKTPANAPPKAPVPAPAKPKVEPTPAPASGTIKAGDTPQTDSAAAGWDKDHLNSLQQKFPYKFQDGVFNSAMSKTGGKAKNLLTGETWDIDADGNIIHSTLKKGAIPKKILEHYENKIVPADSAFKNTQTDPVAKTWDKQSLDIMRWKFPDKFDKKGNWNGGSEAHPTPTAEKLKGLLLKDYQNFTYNNFTNDDAKIIDDFLTKYGGRSSFSDRTFDEGLRIAKEFGLTEIEHQAIYLYTDTAYERLNEVIGGWTTNVASSAELELLRRFEKVMNKGLSKLPSQAGTLRRDVHYSASILDKYKAGSTITEGHFSSTTTKISGVGTFERGSNTIIYFKTKPNEAHQINDISRHKGHEAEVLVKSGQAFKVNSKAYDDKLKKWIIHLEGV